MLCAFSLALFFPLGRVFFWLFRRCTGKKLKDIEKDENKKIKWKKRRNDDEIINKFVWYANNIKKQQFSVAHSVFIVWQAEWNTTPLMTGLESIIFFSLSLMTSNT